jgi:hypothetical protein
MRITIRPLRSRYAVDAVRGVERFDVLVHAAPERAAAPVPTSPPRVPLELRFLLDHSGSMAGDKVATLKRAVRETLHLLREGVDCIAVLAFDDKLLEVLPPQRVGKVAELVEKIEFEADGGTVINPGLNQLICLQLKDPEAIPRLVVFTDGQIGDPQADTFRIAEMAREFKIPFSVFGIGSDYDERFLSTLAERAGNGSTFQHVSQSGEVFVRLESEIALLETLAARDLRVEIETRSGAKLSHLLHTVPQFSVLPLKPDRAVEDLPGLDRRGQAWIVSGSLPAPPPGAAEAEALLVRLRWRDVGVGVGAAPNERTFEVPVRIALGANDGDEDPAWSPFFHAMRGISRTLAASYDEAERSFCEAGAYILADQIECMSPSAKQGDEDAARAMRTFVTCEAAELTAALVP